MISFSQPLSEVFLAEPRRRRSFDEFKRTASLPSSSFVGNEVGDAMPRIPIDFEDDDKENVRTSQDCPPSTQDTFHEVLKEVCASHNQQRGYGDYEGDDDASHDEPLCTGETQINETPVSGRSENTSRMSSEIDVEVIEPEQLDNIFEELSEQNNHEPNIRKRRPKTVNVDNTHVKWFQKRELRARTATQSNPYEADKIRHKSQARGKKMTDAELNQAVKRKTEVVPQRNVRSRSSAGTRARGRKVESDSDSLLDDNSVITIMSHQTNEDKIRENTTLSISVQGEATDAVLETRLSEHSSLAALIAFVNSRWGKVKGGMEVEYLTCKRPWKLQNKDLMIYPMWDEQFDRLFDSIKEAPVWKTQGSDSRSLEVSVVATFTA
jgi:hypothetical protein